jgi:hypothetical protein
MEYVLLIGRNQRQQTNWAVDYLSSQSLARIEAGEIWNGGSLVALSRVLLKLR